MIDVIFSRFDVRAIIMDVNAGGCWCWITTNSNKTEYNGMNECICDAM